MQGNPTQAAFWYYLSVVFLSICQPAFLPFFLVPHLFVWDSSEIECHNPINVRILLRLMLSHFLSLSLSFSTVTAIPFLPYPTEQKIGLLSYEICQYNNFLLSFIENMSHMTVGKSMGRRECKQEDRQAGSTMSFHLLFGWLLPLNCCWNK